MKEDPVVHRYVQKLLSQSFAEGIVVDHVFLISIVSVAHAFKELSN